MRPNEIESVSIRAATALVSSIAGDAAQGSPEMEKIKEARRLCVEEKNPMPLIGMQWPEFVVTGDDCAFFLGEEGNEWNPCLRFDWWQQMIFKAMFDHVYPEIFIKGCTGPGKGACVAIAINLDYDCREECMWNITSDTNKHATEIMFGEITKWRNRMRFPCEGRTLTTTISTHERKFITILNPERNSDGESFSGRHGMKYAFDESSSCPDIFYENACKNAVKIIGISNPRTRVGFFRMGFKGLDNENKTGVVMGTLGKRLCVTIGGLDCTNVKHNRLKEAKSPIGGGIEIDGVHYPEGEEIPKEVFPKVKALIPGQMDLNQYRSILLKSDEKWKVQCFAHGMFPDEDPVSQFIMESWLAFHHKHHDEHYTDIEVNAFGLDVAHSLDGDETTLACGGFGGCRDIHKFKFDSYPKIAERVISIALDYGVNLLEGQHPIAIDYGGGYGAGVGDWIAPQGAWVVAHNPASRAQVVPELFRGQRAEDWGLFAHRLDPKRDWGLNPFALPRDPRMIEELLAMTKVWDKTMTCFGALPKEAMKSAFKDGRSPDSGDAVMLLFRAVREADGLDAILRSSIVSSGQLITSYAGQKASSEMKDVAASNKNPVDVINGILSMYRKKKG